MNNTTINSEIREVINAIHCRPSLSVILPLQAQVSLKKEAAQAFKIAADKAETELAKYYPSEQCALITNKLRALLHNLVIPPREKGVAIYVSPVFEKVIFLATPVEEKLIVDESFEIRDLLYDAKQVNQFLLLALSSSNAKLFSGGGIFGLTPVVSDLPGSIDEFINDAPERVANFSDTKDRKQLLVNKFLHHIDTELANIIQSHHLPLMVLGTEKIIGHFKKLTRHNAAIIGYARGYEEEASLSEYMSLVQPHLDAWKIEQQTKLLERLDEAAGQKLLVTGIKEVWQQLAAGKSGLLVLEHDYRFAAQRGPTPDVIEAISEPYNEFSHIRDAVDDAIEKVLKNGGDVAFTADGSLQEYDHIALICYY